MLETVGHLRLDKTEEGSTAAWTFEVRTAEKITRNSPTDCPWLIDRYIMVKDESFQPRVRLSMAEMVGLLEEDGF
jgi:hypothetical protein